ncbi:zinc ribbon domain-containing protein [Streptomyces sp. NPDC093982]|uniref:zinc ribbon domain-containing protein n=1 Tax=Streptomyces sp. NPDC093982 TaxID=3155077 RepID=UPI0034338366
MVDVHHNAGVQAGPGRGAPSTVSAGSSRPSGLLRVRRWGRSQPLHIRTWTCTACGTVLDRDTNAALNVVKATGLAVSASRSPGLVPAQRGETRTHRDGHPTAAEIPSLYREESRSHRLPAVPLA